MTLKMTDPTCPYCGKTLEEPFEKRRGAHRDCEPEADGSEESKGREVEK